MKAEFEAQSLGQTVLEGFVLSLAETPPVFTRSDKNDFIVGAEDSHPWDARAFAENINAFYNRGRNQNAEWRYDIITGTEALVRGLHEVDTGAALAFVAEVGKNAQGKLWERMRDLPKILEKEAKAKPLETANAPQAAGAVLEIAG